MAPHRLPFRLYQGARSVQAFDVAEPRPDHRHVADEALKLLHIKAAEERNKVRNTHPYTVCGSTSIEAFCTSRPLCDGIAK
jgi:hypothetical protein